MPMPLSRASRSDEQCARGALMIEVLAVLGILMLAIPFMVGIMNDRTEHLADRNMAEQLNALLNAVETYATLEAIGVRRRIEEDGPFAVDIAELIEQGYLHRSWNSVNPFKHNIHALLMGTRVRGEDQLYLVVEPLIVTKGERDIPELRAAKIANLMGGAGGYVSTTMAGATEQAPMLMGPTGAWDMSIDDIREAFGRDYTPGPGSIVALGAPNRLPSLAQPGFWTGGGSPSELGGR